MVVYSVEKLSSYSNGAMQNIAKIHNERTRYTYKCKCGHSISIRSSLESVVCRWCNRRVFKDEEKQKAHDKEMKKREDLLKFKKEMRKHL